MTGRLGQPLRTCGVFVAYVLLSMLTIGRFALPHLASICACNGGESASYMWGLAWWPHALAGGLNPFYTHLLWAPTGGNVAQAAMMPAAAIAAAPITELFGPIASYNVIAILGPALGSLSAYLLCRRLTGDRVAAFLGGYVYGFSCYEFARLIGHLDLAVTFVFPLFTVLVIDRIRGAVSRRRYVVSAAALFLLQAGLSTELLADGFGLGLVLLLCARQMTAAQERAGIDRTVAETAAGGVLALIAGAPFFYYALLYKGAGTVPANVGDLLGIDLLNAIMPTQITAFGGRSFVSITQHFSAGLLPEGDGYFGIPMVAAFAMFVAVGWRSSMRARLAAIGAAVAFVLSLGGHLYVAGHRTPVPLPFGVLDSLPVLDNLEPSRFSVFVTLPMAIAAATLWSRTEGNRRVTRILLVLAALLPFPYIVSALYGARMEAPALFTTAAVRNVVPRGARVLALPFGFNATSMLWQAQSGFSFSLVEGYLRASTPPPFNSDRTVNQLLSNQRPSAAALGAFLHRYHVSCVVVDPLQRGTRLFVREPDTDWVAYLDGLGLHGRAVGGVVVFPVPAA
jgi:hypothetical protein